MQNFKLKKFFSALSAAAVAASLSFQTLLPTVNAVAPDVTGEQYILSDKHELCGEEHCHEADCENCNTEPAFKAEEDNISHSLDSYTGCMHQFNGSYVEKKKPTCTDPGEKVGYCTKCGEIVDRRSIDPLGHKWGSWVTDYDRTCTEDGQKHHTCSRCGTVEYEAIPHGQHKFNGSYHPTIDPTCTEPGEKVGYCDICGDIVSVVEIPAWGHDYGDWIIDKDRTCTEDGEKHHECSRCGYVEYETIPHGQHVFNGSYNPIKQPTCTEEGEKVGYCEICNEIVSRVAIPAWGHSYGDWVIDKERTCTEDGKKHHECTKCGFVEYAAIPHGQHVFNGSYNPIKQPTCTEEGEKVGYCEICNEIVSRVAIPAWGHSYGDWVIDKERTCTEDGKKHHKCTKCGFVEYAAIPHGQHVFNGSYNPIKQPTCTEDGEKVGYCEICNEIVSRVAIPAWGHKWGDWVIIENAKGSKEGSKYHKCTRCGIIETAVIPGCMHQFNGSYVETKKPTCTEPGEKVGHCTKCNEIVDRRTVPALGHRYGAVTVVNAATCSSDGSGTCKCERCGVVKNVTIPHSGHSFNGSYETKQPTCTEDGERIGRCTKCGEIVYRAVLPKLGSTGHTFNGSYERIEPTCTEDGHIIGRCTTCHAIITDTVIPKLSSVGHTFNGSYVTVKNATCTSTGLKEGRCTKCGKVVTKAVIPKKAHRLEYKVTVKPTAEKAGTEEEVCVDCGYKTGNKRTLNAGNITVEDCDYDMFPFCANGDCDDCTSLGLLYMLEEDGGYFLHLKFNTPNDWTVSADDDYVHFYDINGAPCTSGLKGDNDILVHLDSFPYTSDEPDRRTKLTISSGGSSKSYTLSQCNRTVNWDERSHYVSALGDKLKGYATKADEQKPAIVPNATDILYGRYLTNGKVMVYEVDGKRYLGLSSREYGTSNVEVDYIVFEAAAGKTSSTGYSTTTANIKVECVRNLKLVQNEMPLFKSIATISGFYVDVTDQKYENAAIVGEILSKPFSLGADFVIGIFDLDPVSSFTISAVVNAGIDGAKKGFVNLRAKDHSKDGIATETEISIDGGCSLSKVDDEVSAECNVKKEENSSFILNFDVVGPNGSSSVYVHNKSESDTEFTFLVK